MLSRLHSLIFLTTTLLVTLQSQSSHAVKVNNPYGRPAIKYFEDPITQTAGLVQLQAWPFYDPRSFLDFGKVVEVKAGGTDQLVNLLRYGWRQPEWEFVRVGGLEGSFDITAYNACTPVLFDYCGGLLDRAGGVGANFQLKYNPKGNDPRGDNVHWVQRLQNNYNDFGLEVDKIDKPIWQRENPYYDTNADAGADYFVDIPYYAPPDNRKLYFYAETYLLEEVKKPGSSQKTVNIYDGVRWGWEYIPAKRFKKFSDSLSSGYEQDNFQLSELTPGKKFYAYIDNDIPGNQCNPNTYLTAYNDRIQINDDDNSSQIGDGLASALTGIVPNDGIVNFDVRAANPGARGEDKGNYELNVTVFDNEADFPHVVGSSGGGGIGNESPGLTQQNPILPTAKEGSWQVFRNVPGCRWYDPHTTYGFEFQALDDTLFTEILDFPVGDDDRFTVSVGDNILGEFGAGDSVDFLSLFGSGISNFKITGIDSLVGSTQETAFPIQLAFNDRRGSFKFTRFECAQFTHIVWWALSFFGISSVREKITP